MADNSPTTPELIWVKSARTDGRLALWERNEAHPGGEAVITSTTDPVLVARTSQVHQRMLERLIVEDAEGGKQVEAAQAEARKQLEATQKEALLANATVLVNEQATAQAMAEQEQAGQLNAAQAELDAAKAEQETAQAEVKQAEQALKTTEEAVKAAEQEQEKPATSKRK